LRKAIGGILEQVLNGREILERAEDSLPLSTESVPSLLKFTPMLARLTMPLFPGMEYESAPSNWLCTSRSELSVSSGPPRFHRTRH